MPRRASDPLLNVKIASPCGEDWDGMHGDDRIRFCGKCQLNVYNLSSMTRQEAERLVAEREGRLCARFYRRADGTILTADCPVGLAALRKRISAIATAVFSFLFGVGAANGAFNLVGGDSPGYLDAGSGRGSGGTVRQPEVMGVLEAPPEPRAAGEHLGSMVRPEPPVDRRSDGRSRR